MTLFSCNCVPKLFYASNQFIFGLRLYFRCKYSFISCHRFSMEFVSDDWWCASPVDVINSQIFLDTCFGSLSCMKQWPSGNTSCTNGNSILPIISTYTGATIIPSNMLIPVLPLMLMLAHT